VTESHNLKVIQLKETFEQLKQEETTAIIEKYEAQMQQFESKIRQEVTESVTQTEQEKMQSLIKQLEQKKVNEM